MKCSEVELGPGKVGKLEANRLREPVSISSAGKGSSGWAAKSITIHTAEKHTITGLQLSGFDSGTEGGLSLGVLPKVESFQLPGFVSPGHAHTPHPPQPRPPALVYVLRRSPRAYQSTGPRGV